MSLAKAAFSGKVFREPQKRSTSNNVPITYFTFNIGTDEEELIRVRAVGNLADRVEKEIQKDDSLVVEGNLMLSTIKTDTGEEKRIVELT
ncbi:single-stranded DNA-binding protein, partial [bacterium]|nr:single-stranded DNA-binding protein [bacterium]